MKSDEQLAQEIQALADQFEDRQFALMAIRRVAGRLLTSSLQLAKSIPTIKQTDLVAETQGQRDH